MAQIPDHFDLQGHRGCRGLLPENSIPGFIKAIEIGVQTLELDVVMSRDRQIVISHEPWLSEEICLIDEDEILALQKDLMGVKIKKWHFGLLDYETIKQVDCGSKGNARFPEQKKLNVRKPLLEDLFEAVQEYDADVAKTIRYNIEIKSRKSWDGVEQPESPEIMVKALIKLLRENGLESQVTVQSFDHRVLQWMHRVDPEIQLACLEEIDPSMTSQLDKLGFQPAIYSPLHRLVTPRMMANAHERGIRIIPWTVNELDDMQRLISMGVDGLITDYPDRAQKLLNTIREQD